MLRAWAFVLLLWVMGALVPAYAGAKVPFAGVSLPEITNPGDLGPVSDGARRGWSPVTDVGAPGLRVNWFAYAGGDPVNRWDPSGLDWTYYFLDENNELDWERIKDPVDYPFAGDETEYAIEAALRQLGPGTGIHWRVNASGTNPWTNQSSDSMMAGFINELSSMPTTHGTSAFGGLALFLGGPDYQGQGGSLRFEADTAHSPLSYVDGNPNRLGVSITSDATSLRWASGEMVIAAETLSNSQLASSFRDTIGGYMASSLDDRVLENAVGGLYSRSREIAGLQSGWDNFIWEFAGPFVALESGGRSIDAYVLTGDWENTDYVRAHAGPRAMANFGVLSTISGGIAQAGVLGARWSLSGLGRSFYKQWGRNRAAASIRSFRRDMHSLGVETTDINSYVRAFVTSTFRYGRNLNPFKKYFRHYNVGARMGGPWIHDTKSLLSASPYTRRVQLALPEGSNATGSAWTRVPFLRKMASGNIAPQAPGFTGLPAGVTTGGSRQWYVPSNPSAGLPYLNFHGVP